MELVKFGGSSMATAANIRRCFDIVKSRRNHKIVVVSAPGKFGTYATKVTDQLIAATHELTHGVHTTLDSVFKRFDDIAGELLSPEKLPAFKSDLYKTRNEILNNTDDYNFIVSRGEFLTAKLFALHLGFNLVDARSVLVINQDATANLNATKINIKRLRLKAKMPFVVGGFYGQTADGKTALFSRGGSDYTGAVLAALFRARIYKNYTDAYGISTADPRHIQGTKTIPCLDFDSLDILTKNGAGVIHENVAAVLKTHRVPLHVDNTFDTGKSYTEVHSPRCRNANCNFFSITHKQNQIMVVSKTKNAPPQIQAMNTTPQTLYANIQSLHDELSQT